MRSLLYWPAGRRPSPSEVNTPLRSWSRSHMREPCHSTVQPSSPLGPPLPVFPLGALTASYFAATWINETLTAWKLPGASVIRTLMVPVSAELSLEQPLSDASRRAPSAE